MDTFDIFKITMYSNHMASLNNTHSCITKNYHQARFKILSFVTNLQKHTVLTLHQLLLETSFDLTTLSTTEIDKHYFVNHHLTKE